jgi:acetyl-CoA C-acetyltransferase
MPQSEVVLCHPVRTAIGSYNGSLKGTPATDLGAVVRETLARSGLDPQRIDSVVMGNVIQAGNRMNPARQAAIHGGLPVTVPAVTSTGSAAQVLRPSPVRRRRSGSVTIRRRWPAAWRTWTARPI